MTPTIARCVLESYVGVTVAVNVSPPRSTVRLTGSPALSLTPPTKSDHVAIGVPSMASTRSPSLRPASAAGLPASTVPRTGSGLGVLTPAKKKMPKNRNSGRMKFMMEPARITIMRELTGFSQ